MTTRLDIEKCVTDFIQAGDKNDVPALDRILHELYQNVQDGFFKRQGLFRFSKADYKKLVGDKIFGGLPRSVEIGSIEEFGQHMALVRVRLESRKLAFDSWIVTVREGGDWQVLYNFPRIVAKD